MILNKMILIVLNVMILMILNVTIFMTLNMMLDDYVLNQVTMIKKGGFVSGPR